VCTVNRQLNYLVSSCTRTYDVIIEIWSGTRHSVDSLLHGRGPALTLGVETVDVADAVRVLGVLFTPDLALDKHTSAVSTKCFYQLRQLRRVRRSLDTDSAKILVHAFVISRIYYCNVSARQRAIIVDRQASTSPQRSCACDYQHSEV